jgi:hypothetical protein
VIRLEGRRALVEVAHRWVPTAREAWNGSLETPGGAVLSVRTHRTYGTLLKGKRWLRAARLAPSPPPERAASE